ncbi:MAG: magnesium transporter CorA family protein [Acidothermus sp.]|nr:magnesium transporter CorA family protein [Acidothermus sp.]MCL6537292.1 magnesium transporter CorA family protein [Acidothermus sp.]
MPRTRLYRGGVVEKEDFPAEDISEYIGERDVVVWLDLCPADGDDIGLVEDELGLHALAVEDAVHLGQRPKLDHYATHLFLSCYALRYPPGSEELEVGELAVFVTRNALVTVRKTPNIPIEPVMARWDEMADLADCGVGFLLYGLLDTVVDGYFHAVERLDDRVDEIEDSLFDEARERIRAVQRETFAVRKDLMRMRRIVTPMREVVNELMRHDSPLVGERLVPYYQDVYDHVLRVSDQVESLRDMVTTILEANLTMQGNRLNMIMKKVTSWAAIIAVPTAVTGFYGQNVPYPGYGHLSGLLTSSAIIVCGSGLLYWLFRRKDWL